jgi:hypothetical protein
MSYLARLKARIAEKGLGDMVTKPTKPGSVSFVTNPQGRFSGNFASAGPGFGCSAPVARGPCASRP